MKLAIKFGVDYDAEFVNFTSEVELAQPFIDSNIHFWEFDDQAWVVYFDYPELQVDSLLNRQLLTVAAKFFIAEWTKAMIRDADERLEFCQLCEGSLAAIVDLTVPAVEF